MFWLYSRGKLCSSTNHNRKWLPCIFLRMKTRACFRTISSREYDDWQHFQSLTLSAILRRQLRRICFEILSLPSLVLDNATRLLAELALFVLHEPISIAATELWSNFMITARMMPDTSSATVSPDVLSYLFNFHDNVGYPQPELDTRTHMNAICDIIGRILWLP